ncbi:MAG: hypothetical protein ACOYT7_02505 [Patescibacteria group bacterium]
MKILKTIFILFSLVFAFYLLLPDPEFPVPPPDALQSNEPADTETPLRRAYFTNLTREEVMSHYKSQLAKSSFLALPLSTYRLNYPPEEAKTIIRDQTRSTFLEEIVHPFRASVFVNGFEPKDPKDAIFIEGRAWRQKIIVRHIPSTPWVRLPILAFVLGLILVLAKEWKR